jgi:hypothetical protein
VGRAGDAGEGAPVRPHGDGDGGGVGGQAFFNEELANLALLILC